MGNSVLSRAKLRDVRAELERERDRFAANHPRRHAYATALARLADGSYGTCHGCGGDIPSDRLLAIPETLFCVACGARN